MPILLVDVLNCGIVESHAGGLVSHFGLDEDIS